MGVTDAVGLEPAMRIRMTRKVFAGLLFVAEMGDRLQAWPISTWLSQWFHKQSTTPRDNLHGAQI